MIDDHIIAGSQLLKMPLDYYKFDYVWIEKSKMAM